MCETIANQVRRAGARVESIHGDRDQSSRDMALGSFKAGSAKVLVATDVAGRGLDVKTVRLVINYDPANNAEDYVHRIGRTARAGMTGVAVTLLLPSEGKKAADIADVMKKSGKPVPPDLEAMASRSRYDRDDRRQRYSKGGKGGGDRGYGGGDGKGCDSRPGDWTCPGCRASVFASKDACFKCGERKPGGGGGGSYGGGGRGRSRSRSRGHFGSRDYGGDRGSNGGYGGGFAGGYDGNRGSGAGYGGGFGGAGYAGGYDDNLGSGAGYGNAPRVDCGGGCYGGG